MRRAINVYLFAIREWADEDKLAEIEEALTAPNRLDPTTRAPRWWVDEDDAFAGFAGAKRVTS